MEPEGVQSPGGVLQLEVKASFGKALIQDFNLILDLGFSGMHDRIEKAERENQAGDLRDKTSIDGIAGVDNVEVDRNREVGRSAVAVLVVGLSLCDERGESLLFLAHDFGIAMTTASATRVLRHRHNARWLVVAGRDGYNDSGERKEGSERDGEAEQHGEKGWERSVSDRSRISKSMWGAQRHTPGFIPTRGNAWSLPHVVSNLGRDGLRP